MVRSFVYFKWFWAMLAALVNQVNGELGRLCDLRAEMSIVNFTTKYMILH